MYWNSVKSQDLQRTDDIRMVSGHIYTRMLVLIEIRCHIRWKLLRPTPQLHLPLWRMMPPSHLAVIRRHVDNGGKLKRKKNVWIAIGSADLRWSLVNGWQNCNWGLCDRPWPSAWPSADSTWKFKVILMLLSDNIGKLPWDPLLSALYRKPSCKEAPYKEAGL